MTNIATRGHCSFNPSSTHMTNIITRIAKLESERNPAGVIGIVVPCDPSPLEQERIDQRLQAVREAGLPVVYLAHIPRRIE